MKTLNLSTEQDTIDLAKYIAPLLKEGDIITLFGDLGSGKTFFVKQLGKALGIEEEIDSPSFVLMKEYSGGRLPLYHLDLYRLKNKEEIYCLGLFDILEQGITVIEWPLLVNDLLPYQTFKLEFHFDGKKRWVDIIPDKEHSPYF
ncbi:MAG: tRNA (adenosine(37)-N6)-threonylcarbamoyltransferase complex ATPase subunit type 1 TsaE [Candidatus Cloacimonas acidaminovorans]|jgi:tRNA threonylcarbamoyladenosine biosynthesis protein TsaE|nr:tRNA (adenosine(37)-N6)-threonylcarbamoyltransferase complex ATPase subunit type 1 TsaE [Candidatus Cloacimonas acidaminovorans]